MMHAIDVRDIELRLGGKQILSGVSLRVQRGSVFALVGANGAGKTSIIRTLLGLNAAARRKGTLLDRRVGHLGADFMARVGYLPQTSQLPPSISLRRHFGYIRQMYPAWDREFCAQLVRLLGLCPDSKIGQLSVGDIRKADLLTRLAYRPELLLLDEPFAGVDPASRDQIVDGVLRVCGEQGTTVVIASHDLLEIENLVDSVGVVENGRMLICESLESLQARFRRLEFELAGPICADEQAAPPNWHNLQTEGRAMQVVDSAYHDRHAVATAQRIAPGARCIAASPMSLRAIVSAVTPAPQKEGGVA